ncbi:MAG: RluA family pseudouridine synthase [Verrucomicrobia bacterium]|nr:RluA family pseudouridine synthase [Verrucomicrobiota bacterium]
MITRHPILFEDEWLLVIDKPADVLSHPNPGQSSGDNRGRCAFEGSYDHRERCFHGVAGRIWLIHRLDQDTSGILLAAKHADIAKACRVLFEEHRIRKTYLVLVAGQPSPPSGAWRDHLDKRTGHGMVRSTPIPGRSPNAELRYRIRSVLQQFRATTKERSSRLPALSLLEIALLTGRTHQIRVQSARRGHPVAGDRIYGDFQLNRELRRNIGLRRLFLHAAGLQFIHPKTRQPLDLRSPLPGELARCLKR